ncbi:hypothetical protein U9M48_036550 [Paspalum notatum var. saurae]|uniref:Uncharacterized protein n=1 Tax=Paspalum notatum var. saurae TaxID=547442 RepID=A0AAQ3UFG4_PASNO
MKISDLTCASGVAVDPWVQPGFLGFSIPYDDQRANLLQKANAGVLTNFEVLDFLQSRGAKIDPMGCLGAVAASECKMIEECGKRFSRDERGEACDEDVRVLEFLDIVKEVLPPPPPKAEADVEAEAEVEAKITQE